MTSPCTTCATMADCSTCLPRLAWEGAQIPVELEPWCNVCDELPRLLRMGETIDGAAVRLEMRRDSMLTHARRNGVDLSRWLAEEKEQRDADRPRRQRVTL